MPLCTSLSKDNQDSYSNENTPCTTNVNKAYRDQSKENADSVSEEHDQSIIGEIEEIHTNELQHDQSENDKIKEPSGVTSQSPTVESSKDYVDVMDTDHEASCSTSELSIDNLSICNSNVNKISQDSFGWSADVPSTSNMNANEDVTSINFKLKEVHNEISVDQSKENVDDEIIIIQNDTPDDFVGHNSLNKMNAVGNSNSISLKYNQTKLELDVVAQENDKNILCVSEKSVQSNELQHDQSKNDEIEEMESNDLQHSQFKNDEIEEIHGTDLQHSQSKNDEIEEIHGTDLQHSKSKNDEIEEIHGTDLQRSQSKKDEIEEIHGTDLQRSQSKNDEIDGTDLQLSQSKNDEIVEIHSTDLQHNQSKKDEIEEIHGTDLQRSRSKNDEIDCTDLQLSQSKNDEIVEIHSTDLQHNQSKKDEIEEIHGTDLQRSQSKNDEIDGTDLQLSQSKNDEIVEIHSTDLQHNQSKMDEIEKPLDINSRSPIVESSKDDVYIMDVDTDAF
ncbi:hypothetical protein CEXT_311651 [Caerostris extrusa]|uniref:Uncharacterized protein n=1 Tax=Caerostris extrusa TaxID=172846 RepID=A0AAV4SN98_CAEEX|nr:hypothetical protein CEXT_311651 [Caerostris extrusa]